MLAYYADKGLEKKIGTNERPPAINPGILLQVVQKRLRLYLRNEFEFPIATGIPLKFLGNEQVFVTKPPKGLLQPHESTTLEITLHVKNDDILNERWCVDFVPVWKVEDGQGRELRSIYERDPERWP